MAKLPIAVPNASSREDGDFTWFAYGSSLDREAFSAWCAQHGYQLPDFSGARPGKLLGYRLAFDVQSRFWGGAVASVSSEPGSEVEGLLIPLPATARTLVDHKEGAVSGLYEPFSAQAIPLEGAAEPVSVVVYRSAPSRRLAQEGAPSPGFVDTLVKGARAVGLSAGYRARLEALRPQTRA